MLQTKRTRIDKLGVPPQNPLGSMIGLSTIVALLIGGGLASGLVWQGRQLPTPENWLLGDPFVAAGHGVAAAAAILISLFGMLAIKRNSELTYIDKSKVVWSEAIDYARNSHLRFTADELGGAYESFRRFWSVDLQGRVHLLCVIASLPGVLALFGAIRNLQASPTQWPPIRFWEVMFPGLIGIGESIAATVAIVGVHWGWERVLAAWEIASKATISVVEESPSSDINIVPEQIGTPRDATESAELVVDQVPSAGQIATPRSETEIESPLSEDRQLETQLEPDVITLSSHLDPPDLGDE